VHLITSSRAEFSLNLVADTPLLLHLHHHHHQARNVEKAEEWFDAMTTDGITPDQVSYNVMIKAYAITGDVDGAERWFRGMWDNGVGYDRKSFAAMASAYYHTTVVPLERVQTMLECLRTHLQDGPPAGDNDSMVSHDTVSSILKCAAQCSPPEPGLAMAWFKEFIPLTFLNESVESALHQAVGADEASAAIAWARRTSSSARADRRSADGHGGMGHNHGMVKATGGMSSQRRERAQDNHDVHPSYPLQMLSNPPSPHHTSPNTGTGSTPARHSSRATAANVGGSTNADRGGSAVSAGGSGEERVAGESVSPIADDFFNRGQSSPHSPDHVRGRGGEGYGPLHPSTVGFSTVGPPNGEVVVEILAPEYLHRYLIGTRGVMMRTIQQDTGARLFFPTTRNAPPWAEPSNKDAITIVGDVDACERAKKSVLMRVADHKMRSKVSEDDGGGGGSSGGNRGGGRGGGGGRGAVVADDGQRGGSSGNAGGADRTARGGGGERAERSERGVRGERNERNERGDRGERGRERGRGRESEHDGGVGGERGGAGDRGGEDGDELQEPSFGYELPKCTWDRFGYDLEGENDDSVIVEIYAPEKCHRYLIGMRGAAIKQIQSRVSPPLARLIFFLTSPI
jgi:pentatricopeptide repeat protein